MYWAILPINVRIDMSYLFELCNFTIKLSNICRHDLKNVLKHSVRIDRLINMTFKKHNKLVLEFPLKINMSITDVNTAPGQNTCVLSIPSIHKYCKSPQAIHNYCEPSQMKPAILYFGKSEKWILIGVNQHATELIFLMPVPANKMQLFRT